VDEWIEKMCYIMEYYSALKEILMKLQNIMLSEGSQTEKNKNTYFMVSLVSGILKKKIKKVELTGTESKMVVARGKGGEGNQERLVKGFRLLTVR